MAGVEGFGHVSRPRNFTIDSIAVIGRFPCEMPPALLTPSCHSEFRTPQAQHAKIRPEGRIYAWLGWRDSNPRMSAPKTDALPLGHTPIPG